MKRVDIVGFGPGCIEQMTGQAITAIEKCDYVVGFNTYVDIIKEYFPEKKFVSNGMGQEEDRVLKALSLAKEDNHVCIVCSGDSQIYGMAALAYELKHNYEDVFVNTIPGVTAALSGSALLGSVVGNDLCIISLSDYHVSWNQIEKRLRAMAECDFVMALYNVRSKHREDSLKKACDILLDVIDEQRVCGIAENIGRRDERSMILTLKELREYPAGMYSTVFVGNSKTRVIDNKLITPRGYKVD